MQMTNEEICRDYRLAKHKANQIEVLAELNLCKPAEIIEILESGGVTVGNRTKAMLGETTGPKKTANPKPKENSEPESAPADWKTSLKAVTERIVELKLIRDSADKELSEIYQTLGTLCGKE